MNAVTLDAPRRSPSAGWRTRSAPIGGALLAQAAAIHRGPIALAQISARTLLLAGDTDPLAVRRRCWLRRFPTRRSRSSPAITSRRSRPSLRDRDRRFPRLSEGHAGDELAEVICIALAGLAAGTINTVVGSGTLITFPVLLAFGYAPVIANVSNTIGLVPGSVSGAIGYRRELAGQRGRVSGCGRCRRPAGATGAVLLLMLPSSAFKAIVPVFIVLALV